ncbi:PREDICTED: uncharacterized protein LOC104779362 [Camelina sativa]|uniref:Uncharacterized protein LOC104779362 n=1 Tax=Camelina sativa TaxID=90675 RepID=A0ABM0YJM4_CAMSA|nr:PREDICTED: uncharacterized protein LOC104779362 [Camelina sativa]
MLKEPHSLLRRVLQAKYFSKTEMMDAKLGFRPSHAWRSIFQGINLIKQGLKWRIGNGDKVRTWNDPWIDNPPIPARCLSQHKSEHFKVSSLMKPNSTQWCPEQLKRMVHPEDISHIQKVRPIITKASDMPVWIFTRHGQYTVKSGYHQITKSSKRNMGIVTYQPPTRIWKEANTTITPWNEVHLDKRSLDKSRTETIHNQPHPFYCCTDGSWVDATSKAGIGWSFHNAHGKCILKGSSAIEPTCSPLETEAIALREALIQVKRLNYQPVTFCGDSRVLYKYLEQYTREKRKPADISEIRTYLEDILAFTNVSHRFLYINRKDNDIADRLVKTARIVNSFVTIF